MLKQEVKIKQEESISMTYRLERVVGCWGEKQRIGVRQEHCRRGLKHGQLGWGAKAGDTQKRSPEAMQA